MKILQIIMTAAVILIPCLAKAQLVEPKPRLYPNKYLSQVGEGKANQDIASCSADATKYIKNSKQTGEGLKHGARGAAKGALLGTVGGAIVGNTGRGAAAGAVMGTTNSAMKGIGERGSRNPAFQQFVNSCLEDKGYKVIEWK